MSTEQVSAAQLYKEYTPQIKPSSSIYGLWKQARESFDFTERPEEIEFLQLLKRYNETILSMPGEPLSRIEGAFLKKEIGREGFRILCDDYFKFIDEGDIVEVYTLENIQLFRNFEYFKYSSYTISELISQPWPDLFVRDDNLLPTLHKEVMDILKLEPNEMRAMEVPVHSLREAGGRQYPFEISFKYGCPVVDRYGNKTAFAVSQKARRLDIDNVVTFH